ncbi:hypothetical protein SDJN02_13394, partial [Cucurbita argyrosperma subsp. argyrosperma]
MVSLCQSPDRWCVICPQKSSVSSSYARNIGCNHTTTDQRGLGRADREGRTLDLVLEVEDSWLILLHSHLLGSKLLRSSLAVGYYPITVNQGSDQTQTGQREPVEISLKKVAY